MAVPGATESEKLVRGEDNPPYLDDPFAYSRLKTREVMVGKVGVGGDNPIRLQSMTIADTMDTRATVAEAIQLYEAGSEIVRITAPSKKDAENLGNIKRELERQGYDIPICADIHFAPNAAMTAVEHVEKVRINPGNYTDRKKFKTREYTDAEYAEELERVHDDFKPLVLRAKELGRAMRIGTNHGSLSDRIMNRFGDTPQGMVESAIEFIKIAEQYDYHDIIVSMKASNPVVMVHAYRLLVQRFRREGMQYPLHLGVTEAGEGTDGRIKSVIGIGSLLEDGIGDTIRVSLTEDSVHEIPVARKIAARYNSIRKTANELPRPASTPDALARSFFDYVPSYSFKRRNSRGLLIPAEIAREKTPSGSTAPVRIVTSINAFPEQDGETVIDEINAVRNMGCDAVLLRGVPDNQDAFLEIASTLKTRGLHIPLLADLSPARKETAAELDFERLQGALHGIALTVLPGSFESVEALVPDRWLQAIKTGDLFLCVHFRVAHGDDPMTCLDAFTGALPEGFVVSAEPAEYERSRLDVRGDATALVRRLAAHINSSVKNPDAFPILLRQTFASEEDALYGAALHQGGLLLDGLGDALCVDYGSNTNSETSTRLCLDILQAVRLRMVRTEFISCPSCGRTLFDLQETTARIKARTGHLKGVKIAIMGCIVNGPGEMADADFGYVGAGPGKIHLYRERTIVKANIPSERADEELVALIKEHGMWQEKNEA